MFNSCNWLMFSLFICNCPPREHYNLCLFMMDHINRSLVCYLLFLLVVTVCIVCNMSYYSNIVMYFTIDLLKITFCGFQLWVAFISWNFFIFPKRWYYMPYDYIYYPSLCKLFPSRFGLDFSYTACSMVIITNITDTFVLDLIYSSPF